MGDDPDWPALLDAYASALEEFERVTKALTAALIDRDSYAEDLLPLFAAESTAREAVMLHRVRLMNAWRDSERATDVPIVLAADRDQRV